MLATAGYVIKPKALKKIPAAIRNKVPTTVQPKSDTKEGSWFCCDCAEYLQNNFAAQSHAKSHHLGWWTGIHVEQAE